ncbi:hypothetical protein CLIB1444_19S00100 [[Candida] jaroonii]|uniref:Uncharacterized protein n=1 Tax=[Candida] jaroonii TaxID=467808 RepID=A0ACA9YG43_9ASCO|nr:hypothetical protein CLIB1444_19S00100 [[Candida] jaroonii]
MVIASCYKKVGVIQTKMTQKNIKKVKENRSTNRIHKFQSSILVGTRASCPVGRKKKNPAYSQVFRKSPPLWNDFKSFKFHEISYQKNLAPFKMGIRHTNS